MDLFVVAPNSGSLDRLLRRLNGRSFHWAYVGQSVVRSIGLGKRLSGQGQALEFSQEFHRTARELRGAYIDYIGALSLSHGSPRWWLSWLSEKNVWFSKCFLHACYVKTCLGFIEKGADEVWPMVFVVEDDVVRRCLISNMGHEYADGLQVIEPRLRDRLESLRGLASMILHRVFFVLRGFYRIVVAKYLHRMPEHKTLSLEKSVQSPLTLVVTWVVDRRQFSLESKFDDAYFRGLSSYCRSQGKKVATVPVVLNTVPYRVALAHMGNSDEPFLVPHSYLTILDVLRSAVRSVARMSLNGSPPPFAGMEISGLIRHEMYRQWVHHRVAEAWLFYELPRRWKEAGMSVERVIFPYESHIWSRALTMGLRRYMPETRIVGYQHSSVPSLVLNYFISPQEAGIAPLPDSVVANGEHPAELFRESGYGHERVRVGGALRYQAILRSTQNGHRSIPNDGPPTVLVATSIGIVESSELVWKTYQAFRDRKDLRVVIKCHPATPYRRVAKTLGEVPLPEHFSISDEPLGHLLKQSRVMIYSTSSSCIEALANGVPVVHLQPDFDLDFDPLDFAPDSRRVANSPQELASAVDQILEAPQDVMAANDEKGKRVVHQLLGEVNEASYAAFLK